MLTVYFEGIGLSSHRVLTLQQDESITLEGLNTLTQNFLLVPKEDIYFIHNGKRLVDNSPLFDGVVRVLPRLVGGKGGFGSMLRAIGAQIEKTTNREACRDLSGRRLRDINEEKRLKNWIGKKAEREREAEERRKKRLEKLRSEPKVEFSDKQYEEERNKLTEVVHDAVEKGFEAATSNPSTSNSNASKKPPVRKGFMFEEDEISDDSSDSSSSSVKSNSSPKESKRKTDSDSDEPSPAKKQRLEGPEAASESSSQSSEGSSDEKN